MSHTSFIKIVADKLVHNALPEGLADDATIRVVSILGKARMGKSTFLNCMIAALGLSKSYIFPTQETDEHCTFGIDVYAIPSQNLILLDCQGVEYDDSSQDSKLLLLTYLLSDVVIFNERNMLSNATLNSFQPMMAFLQYLELEQIRKPHLLFRISDVDLELDPEKNLQNLLTKKRDQYQNIRDSIKELFVEVAAVKTNGLDRAEKGLLRTHNYAAMLAIPENGFAAAVRAIQAALGGLKTAPRTFRVWAAEVPAIIDLINKNEKIDYRKLDVVELLAYKEINEWLQAVDASLYMPIAADGLAATETAVLRPRAAAVAAKLAAFTQHFSALPEGLIGPRYDELRSRLEGPVNEAKAAMLQKATDLAVAHLKTHYSSLCHTFNSNNESLATNFVFDAAGKYNGISPTNPFGQPLFLENRKYACHHLYFDVAQAVHHWRKDQFWRINSALLKALETENEEYARAQAAAQTFRDSVIQHIKWNMLNEIHLCIKESIDVVLADIISATKSRLKKEIQDINPKSVQVSVSFIEGYLQPFSIITSVTEERRILSPRLNALLDRIGTECETLVRSSDIPKIIVSVRRRILARNIEVRRGPGLGPFETKLIEVNPGVEFVSFVEPQPALSGGASSAWYTDYSKSAKVAGMTDIHQYLFMTRDRYNSDYKMICTTALNLMLFDKVIKNYYSALNLFHRIFVTKTANHRIIDLTVRGKTRREHYFAETFRAYYMKAALIVDEVA